MMWVYSERVFILLHFVTNTLQEYEEATAFGLMQIRKGTKPDKVNINVKISSTPEQAFVNLNIDAEDKPLQMGRL